MIYFFSPLEQFEIFFITEFLYFINITNYLIIGVISCFLFLLFASLVDLNYLLPSKVFYIIEMIYFFIFDLLIQQSGYKSRFYFPLICTLFYIILFSNFIGLFPFSFTLTSHLMTTLFLSSLYFFAFIFLGFLKHGIKFLLLFIPNDVPVLLVPFLTIIEFISFISRVFSLAIRLFANMMSGHALLFILSSFFIKIKKFFYLNSFFEFLFSLFPLVIIFLILFLEEGIAFLQAYVFVVLILIYLNESLSGGHDNSSAENKIKS
jgi:ATP synthase subunit 6